MLRKVISSLIKLSPERPKGVEGRKVKLVHGPSFDFAQDGQSTVHRLLLVAISAVLLVLAYPNCNFEFIAWIALVPLFFSLENKSLKQRFISGYIFGLVFFTGILYWLANVSVPGAMALVLFMSVFPAIFASLYSNKRHYVINVILVPCLWVSVEYLRAHLFTGFPWALLGYSQSFNLYIIQIADITGVYGISFLVVLTNFAIYLALKKTPYRFYILFFVFALVAYGFTYGQNRLKSPYPVQKLKIAVIQGNIPQDKKWDPEYRQFIADRYAALTEESLKEKPHLVIWPETAVPGYLEEEKDLRKAVEEIAIKGNTNLLVGTFRVKGNSIFNSALLISETGKIKENYDKIHLVPFGEFVPLGNMFSWLRSFVDKPIGDFAKGKEFTVFTIKVTNLIRQPGRIQKTTDFYKFSALICFEDIFPELSRNFVKNGARFLVNMTNDAWFGKSSAPYQHMQGSIFRAVENRVPVVRSANTGLSCIIDNKGRIQETVRADGKDIFVEGYIAGYIEPVFSKTIYTRFGDVFSFGCIIISLLGLVLGRAKPKTLPILIVAILCSFPTAVNAETYPEGKFKFSLPFGKKYDYNNILVTRVIDGDTVELENTERVRLIGIDTPESRINDKLERDARRSGKDYRTIMKMGLAATKFTKSLVDKKRVRLEFDIEKRDRYGRLLAYVYLPDDRMLNAELVKEGYAQVYTFQPNIKHVDLFLKLQEEAREENKGLWGEG